MPYRGIPQTTLDDRYVNVTGDTMIGTNSTTFFQIQQADTTPVFNVDTTNARVGIGTTGPTQKLEVYTTDTTDGLSIYTYENASVNKDDVLGNFFFKYENPAEYQNPVTQTIGAIKVVASHNFDSAESHSGSTALAFYTANRASYAQTLSEKMRIDRYGNVGIGTTGPSDKLEIDGNLRFSSAYNGVRHSSTGGFTIQPFNPNARGYLSIVPSGTATESYIRLHSSSGAASAAPNGTENLQFGGGYSGAPAGTWSFGSTIWGAVNADSRDIAFLVSNTSAGRIEALRIAKSGNVGIGVTDPDTKLEVLHAGNQLKLSFDATDNAIFAVDTNGDLTITASGDEIKVADWVRHTSASYRRYYHLDLASFDPGASGATWVEAGANGVGGWQLNAVGETLQSKVDVHADWDGASDPVLELRFQINTASAEDDTVDLKVVAYYMGNGESVTKTQTVEVATNVGDGGIKAQYTMFTVELPLNWDETDNNIEVGDCIAFQVNLETDTSEIDDITLNAFTYYYHTTHTGIESGDT